MHRVDTSTASAALPAVDVAGTPGFFTKGNPANSTPATVPGQDWFNMVQEELNHVVESSGLVPDQTKTDYTQLAQAIALLSVPTGSIITGYFYTIPAGFVGLNGTILSRVTDKNLWDYISAINAVEPGLIVSDTSWLADPTLAGHFSSGDGSTTFRIPQPDDWFLRIKSAGRGLGSYQADEFKSHNHTISPSSQGSGGSAGFQGAFWNGGVTGFTGGTETRPKNIAVRAILKR